MLVVTGALPKLLIRDSISVCVLCNSYMSMRQSFNIYRRGFCRSGLERNFRDVPVLLAKPRVFHEARESLKWTIYVLMYMLQTHCVFHMVYDLGAFEAVVCEDKNQDSALTSHESPLSE